MKIIPSKTVVMQTSNVSVVPDTDNRDYMFDEYLNTQTEFADEIIVDIDFNNVDRLALFNIDATSVDLILVNDEPSLPPAENLVGYWSMDEGSGTTVADSSGNGNDGTISGTVNWVSGVSGTALDFEPAGASIDCGSDASLRQTGDKTISLWYRNDDAIPKASGHWWICENEVANASGFIFIVLGGTGCLWFRQSQAGASTIVQSTTAITPGTLQHLCVVVESNNVTFYIDGVDAGGGGVITEEVTATDTFKIGNNSTSQGPDGLIDEFRFYNKALTASEVTGLYKQVVQMKTIDLEMSDGEYQQWIIEPMYIYANATLKVTINNAGSTAKCGKIGIGLSVDVGATQYSPKIAFTDYSIKAEGIYGTYLKQGNWAKLPNITTHINFSEIDAVYEDLVAVRGSFAFFEGNQGDTDFESLRVYGFLEDWKITIDNPTVAWVDFDIKGAI